MIARFEVTGRRPASLSFDAWLELQRVVSLKEAARLTGLSIDTLKRRHADVIVDLSPRRRGMRLHHALAIGGNT
jgi:hypothetical protein